MSNDKASPSKKFMSNWSIEKLHEMNFQVIGIVIRCDPLREARTGGSQPSSYAHQKIRGTILLKWTICRFGAGYKEHGWISARLELYNSSRKNHFLIRYSFWNYTSKATWHVYKSKYWRIKRCQVICNFFYSF